ncbi:unnamed protein product [Heligmosomoides polygyrus]|uniref:Secreted protein n=1 Tax=Heligmosomoides polygyrus TaxID=6339 RepID=A0A183GCK9_HELPZ|nr:unnamed protein product [Heligmosomoides polygyrus]
MRFADRRLFGTAIDLLGRLVDMFGTVTGLLGTLVDVFGTATELLGTLVDVFGRHDFLTPKGYGNHSGVCSSGSC